MKLRILVTSLGVSALFLLASATLAQGPEPLDRERQHVPPPEPDGRLEEPEPEAWPPRPRLQPVAEGPVEPTAVTLGEPGLSFRYVDTFGVTEQAYPADVQHLNRPMALFIDGADNLFVVEEFGQRMLKYRLSDGQNLMTIGTAGLRGHEYLFTNPQDVALDSSGNIWVVDNHRVTQYDSSGSFLQVFPDWDDNPWWSGDDNGHFDDPRGIAFDSSGRLYVSDRWNHRIQVYSFVSGSPIYSATIGVTGVSGSDNSHFDEPAQIVIDGSDRLYVADHANHRVQRCTYSAGWTCETFHGTGTAGAGDDELSWPYGLGIDTSDSIYIADMLNGRVKRCSTAGSCSTVVSGLWPNPYDVAVDSAGDLYVSDWMDCTIRKYDGSGTFLGTLAGTSGVPYLTDNSHFNAPYGVAVDASGNIYVSTTRGYRVLKLNAGGTTQWAVGTPGVWGSDNVHFGAWWDGPGNVAVDASGNVYVADTGNHRIQKFNSSGSYVTTLGSYGSGDYQFDCPDGVAVDASGNIYVADSCNHRVQIYNSALTYIGRIGVTGVPGDDNAHFNYPWGATVDNSGSVYVADGDNRRVQKCIGSGFSWSCSTFAGVTGEWGEDFAHFATPRDVAVDDQGRVYVADIYNQRVQVFDSSGSYLTTIGGEWGGNSGQFRHAAAVDVDNEGNVYVADHYGHRVQKFAPGVPGWTQVNINGFGDRWNGLLLSLATFNGKLYAGTSNWQGGEVWRSGSEWEQVVSHGFGESDNGGIDHLIEFDGYLYVSTSNENGGQVWRTPNGTSWTGVAMGGFGDSTNAEVCRFAVFSDTPMRAHGATPTRMVRRYTLRPMGLRGQEPSATASATLTTERLCPSRCSTGTCTPGPITPQPAARSGVLQMAQTGPR